jgi:hypothetical protein
MGCAMMRHTPTTQSISKVIFVSLAKYQFGDTHPTRSPQNEGKFPLRPLSIAVLAALAAGEANSYGVEQQVKFDFSGSLVTNGLSIYREIIRLAAIGYIEKAGESRPIRYRLTAHGRKAVASATGDARQT